MFRLVFVNFKVCFFTIRLVKYMGYMVYYVRMCLGVYVINSYLKMGVFRKILNMLYVYGLNGWLVLELF